MTPTQYALIAIGILLIAIFLFSIFKGIIKMILLAVAIISAIACWLFIQRNGISLLSLVIANPEHWMVQAASYIGAFSVLLIFFHGLSWISHIFSFRKGASSGSVITSILMSILMLWIGYVGFSYASNIALISHYHKLSQCHLKGEPAPQMPAIVTAKNRILSTDAFAWLQNIDPLDSRAQTNLASLVAYGCSLPEKERLYFYHSRLAQSGINYPSRFITLFNDLGLQKIVEQENFAALLENELLQTFIQNGNSAQYLEKAFSQDN